MSKLVVNGASRAASLSCLFIVVPLLSGCWDRTEVNDLALITGAAFDKREGSGIELSVQVFVPRTDGGGSKGMSSGSSSSSGSSGSGQTFVRSAKGVTIADAMSKLQEELPRKIFWGHTDVFVIGENLAKEGIRDQADFLLRHPQTRERADVLVSKGNAKKTLELLPPLERSSSEVLREMAKSKLGMHVTVINLSQMLTGDAGAAAIPWVEIIPSEQNPGSPIPYVHGTAVFKKDKMVGQIDPRLTRGVLFLRNEIGKAVITAKLDDTESYVSFFLLRNKTELIPRIEGDKWSLTAKFETEASVIQNATNLDLADPDIVPVLEKLMQKEVENRVQGALNRAQKNLKADIFDFAEVFHRKYPKQWNKMKSRWDEIFPEIEVKLEVISKIDRPGMITSGGTRPKEEVQK